MKIMMISPSDNKKVVETMSSTVVPLEIIAKAVADFYGISESQLFQRSRKRSLTDKRYIFFSLARYFNGFEFSYQDIADYCTRFNYRAFNHATVMYGEKQAGVLYENEHDFKVQYATIRFNIGKSIGNEDIEFIRLKQDVISRISRTQEREEIKTILQEFIL